ncbi:hypothetical protein D3C74_464470 [compost metagenome]
MSRFKISDPVVVDDLNDTDLVDIIGTLLAFIMVNQNHLFGFACNVLSQARSLHAEMVKRILGFSADFSETNRLNIPT